MDLGLQVEEGLLVELPPEFPCGQVGTDIATRCGGGGLGFGLRSRGGGAGGAEGGFVARDTVFCGLNTNACVCVSDTHTFVWTVSGGARSWAWSKQSPVFELCVAVCGLCLNTPCVFGLCLDSVWRRPQLCSGCV